LITKTASNYKVKNFDELILALQKLKENSGRLTLPEGKSQLIDSGTASLMLQLNDKLTDPNIRPKFEADIMTWAGFLRLANFAWGKSSFNKDMTIQSIKKVLQRLLKTSTDELGGIHDIDFAQWEGDGVDEETDAINMQKMISSGQAWTMQGSYGRSAMQYLEAGMCMLGKEGHNDYYGNYVPSRTEVKAGTKGSEALCKKNYPDLYKKYIKLGL